MKNIYTRTGDNGTTRIKSGQYVEKDDIIIETMGTFDELSAQLGVVRCLLPRDHEWQNLLIDIQKELLIIMSHIATPEGVTNPKKLNSQEFTSTFEGTIDAILAKNKAPKDFVIAGDTLLSSHLHVARTIARRAERRLCTLNKQRPINKDIIRFANRLSDLLFAMACSDVAQK